MSVVAPLVVGVAIAALFVWLVASQRATAKAGQAALEQLGFHPCPDKKAWLEETIARIERNGRVTVAVEDARCLDGPAPLYFYTKARAREAGATGAHAPSTQEILFPLRRKSSDGLVLMMKPSALKSGVATDLISAVAGGALGIQPEGLEKIEIPIELLNGNLVAALGPRAGSLLDLVDRQTLDVLNGLGDAGGMIVQCRDTWCSVGGLSRKDFKIAELVERIKPLLRA